MNYLAYNELGHTVVETGVALCETAFLPLIQKIAPLFSKSSLTSPAQGNQGREETQTELQWRNTPRIKLLNLWIWKLD